MFEKDAQICLFFYDNKVDNIYNQGNATPYVKNNYMCLYFILIISEHFMCAPKKHVVLPYVKNILYISHWEEHTIADV